MIIVMRKLICTDGIDFPGASKLYRTAAVSRPEQKTETWAVKKARGKQVWRSQTCECYNGCAESQSLRGKKRKNQRVNKSG